MMSKLRKWRTEVGPALSVGSGRDSGFTIVELLAVMLVVSLLAGAGLSSYGAWRERTLRAEADALWQELRTSVDLYRIDKGEWPAPYTHAEHLGSRIPPWGALTVNLAPPDKYPDRSAAEKMVGRPGTGGPTSEHPTGHLILENGQVCIWKDGVASQSNDESCPE